MADIIGLTGILFVSLITVLIAIRWSSIGNILYMALAVRVTFLLIGHYVMPLPESNGDAASFEGEAFYLSQLGLFNLMSEIPGPSSGFIVWLIAVVYSLTDRSILLAQSISLFFGVGTVFIGWLAAQKLWGNRAASKAGWMLALFPSLILYSCLTLRESYACFFIAVAILGVVNWSSTGSYKSIILALAGFIGATYFHGGLIIGLIVFIVIIGIIHLRRLFKSSISSKNYLKVLLINLSIVILIVYYVSGKFEIPKIGSFSDATDLTRLYTQQENSTEGDSAFPKWLIVNNTGELFYKGPIRIVYFIFSPFPWDVKKTSHLIGLIDASFYLYLTYLILLNQKTISSSMVLKIILLILIAYTVLFGLSVGNFGTGIRHRAKFLVLFILLVAPLLPKFVMYTNNKLDVKNILKKNK